MQEYFEKLPFVMGCLNMQDPFAARAMSAGRGSRIFLIHKSRQPNIIASIAGTPPKRDP